MPRITFEASLTKAMGPGSEFAAQLFGCTGFGKTDKGAIRDLKRQLQHRLQMVAKQEKNLGRRMIATMDGPVILVERDVQWQYSIVSRQNRSVTSGAKDREQCLRDARKHAADSFGGAARERLC